MKSSASKIKMTSYDDLFGGNEETVYSGTLSNAIQNIEISKLFSFENHPFKVLDDDKMEENKESIEKYGVLVPIIVRPKADGNYEIIAGHRRKRACELLGISTIPAIVRDLDDEESTIIMVDSNIQRENLLFSEKAYAYKMKLEAIKRQGVRTNTASRQVGEKYSVNQISENSNDSARNIHRYIRLTELITTFLDMTDERKIAFNTAVELSYLSSHEQEMLFSKIEELEVIPSMAQATKLKKYSSERVLNEVVIDSILSETVEKSVQVVLKKDKLRRYFPSSYSSNQIEETIISLLEKWHKEQ
ncbi:MAG: ParB/RepB/Spo0J family partition protein [Anaerotignaceae bacterium]